MKRNNYEGHLVIENGEFKCFALCGETQLADHIALFINDMMYRWFDQEVNRHSIGTQNQEVIKDEVTVARISSYDMILKTFKLCFNISYSFDDTRVFAKVISFKYHCVNRYNDTLTVHYNPNIGYKVKIRSTKLGNSEVRYCKDPNVASLCEQIPLVYLDQFELRDLDSCCGYIVDDSGDNGVVATENIGG